MNLLCVLVWFGCVGCVVGFGDVVGLGSFGWF